MAACGESIHVIGFGFVLFALLRGCRGSIGILESGLDKEDSVRDRKRQTVVSRYSMQYVGRYDKETRVF